MNPLGGRIGVQERHREEMASDWGWGVAEPGGIYRDMVEGGNFKEGSDQYCQMHHKSSEK